MKRFLRIIFPILILGTLASPLIDIGAASAAATSGDGTMVVSPTTTAAGSTGNVLSFVFTANQGGGSSCFSNCGFGSGSYLTLVVPSGWTAPNTTSGTPGYTTVANAPSTGCSTSSILSITGSGPWTLTVDMTCANNSNLTVTYGAGTGGGVTAPTNAGISTFTTSTRSGSSGSPLAIGTSPTVTVVGPAAKLAFTSAPGSTTAGSSFSTQPVIQVEDSAGNLVTTDTSQVTLAITASTGTAGAQLSCGTNPLAATGGIATFSGCSIDRPGTNYTLTATDGSLASAVTGTFNITAGTATSGSGTMTVSPTSTTVGSTGNTFAFIFTAPVGATFSSGSYVTLTIPSGWTAPSTTNGNAGYTTYSAGTCSPSAIGVAGQVITVTQACTYGTSFTITYGTGTNVTHVTAPTTAGPVTFSAGSHNGSGGSATTLTAGSPQVTLNPGPANKLAFVQQPSNAAAGSAISPSVTVQVEDQYGNAVADNNFSITLSPSVNSIASGAVASTNSSGLATFAVVINVAHNGYTLTAAPTNSGTGVSNAPASNSFNINPGAVAQLVFTQQPVGNVAENTNFSTQPKVSVEDANGNVVTTDSGTVTLAISSYTAGNGGTTQGSISCTNTGGLTATASSGVATFSGCTITGTAGAGTYVLSASRSGLTGPFTSSNVVINAGTAAQLSLAAATTTPTAGVADNLTITAEDSYGNTVTTYTGSKSLTFTGASALGSNNPTVTNASGTATNFGTAESITFSSGTATVSGSSNGQMKLYKAGTDLIVVSDGSINNGSGLSVTVGVASAYQLAFGQQPTTGYAATAISPSVTVLIEDQYGNLTTSTSNVTLSIFNNPCGGPGGLSGAGPTAAVSGTATFSSLSINEACVGYQLQASDTSDNGGITVVSSTFTMSALVTTPPAALADGATDSGGSGMNSVTYYYCSSPGFTTTPSACKAANNVIGSSSTASTYQVSWSSLPANGQYLVVAYGSDNASNSTLSMAVPVTVLVKNSPTLAFSAPATDATNSAIAASSISATLAGGSSPTGSITYTVFGPLSSAPTTCTSGGSAVGSAVTVTGNSAYNPSAGYTPTTSGNYWWYASYSGDGNNNVATSTCGSGMAETIVSTPATVTFNTAATHTLTVPAHTTSVNFTIVGAGGGGGGGYSGYAGGIGGAAGSLTGTITLPDSSIATTFTVVVGGPGTGGTTSAKGTGGTGCAAGGNGGTGTYTYAGGGGGSTCIYVQGAPGSLVALAAGGGGGSGYGNSGGSGSGGAASNGGTSSGLAGGSTGSATGGGGGSTVSSGSGTVTNNSGGTAPSGATAGGTCLLVSPWTCTAGGTGASGSGNGGGGGGGGEASGGGGSAGGTAAASGGGGGGSGYSGGTSTDTLANASITVGTGSGSQGGGGAGASGGTGATGGVGYATFTGVGISGS